MSEKIDINAADEATLTAISGIGPALAQRIVEYRETVHPFEEVIELAAVPGVSEKMVRGFADLVTVQVATRATAVPFEFDDPDDPPMLAAPEPMELLDAPEQPEALLAAELPEAELPEVEEISVDEADTEDSPATPELAETGEDTVDEVEDKPVAEEVIPLGAPADILEPEEPEAPVEPVDTLTTAVPLSESDAPQPDLPEVEEMPLAEPVPTMPEPDLRASSPPTQPPAEWDTKAQRRGCISTLLGATFGAILGAVLTLAVLAALNNGSLSYSASDSQIRQQLDTEIISRTSELNNLSTRVSLMATEEAAANQQLQTDFESANEATDEAFARNEEIISYLATRSGEFELRLRDVAGAADTFTGFLDGMRLLLDDLDESAATPTSPAPTSSAPASPTATPSAADTTSSPTPTPTPVTTTTPLPTPTAVQPTRTPQPTATPFTFPTSTPAPQP